jgi:hypothetical protein
MSPQQRTPAAAMPAEPGRQPVQPPAARSPQQPVAQPAQPPIARSPTPPTTKQEPTAQTQRPTDTRSAQQPRSPAANTAVVQLNREQQTRLSQVVQRQKAQKVTNVDFSLAVGTVVPRTVRLRALSAELVAFVPQYSGYSYFLVEEQIVIVDPGSLEIVAMVPFERQVTTRTTTKRAAAPASSRTRVTARKRDAYARYEEPRVVRREIEIEVEEPDAIEMEDYPVTVYRGVPAIREYRYYRPGRRVIEVHPWYDD